MEPHILERLTCSTWLLRNTGTASACNHVIPDETAFLRMPIIRQQQHISPKFIPLCEPSRILAEPIGTGVDIHALKGLWDVVQADKEALQSDLAAAEERCVEAEKQSQAGLENEHATSEEVQLLRRQLTEARLVPLRLCIPLSSSYSCTVAR